jgi:hypothetical protein
MGISEDLMPDASGDFVEAVTISGGGWWVDQQDQSKAFE